jgi:hypothetical protein
VFVQDVRLSDEQMLFIAGLPEAFCDLASAIQGHAFVQRVAPLGEQQARDALGAGWRMGFVQMAGASRVRLASHLGHRRRILSDAEGTFEAGVLALSSELQSRLTRWASGEGNGERSLEWTRQVAFHLESGQHVRVETFKYVETYASRMVGPPDPDFHQQLIQRHVMEAAQHFQEEVVLLPPVFVAREGREYLPSKCCTAKLFSSQAESEQRDGSALVVVWFAHWFFDEPLQAFIERSLCRVPWE